MFRWDCSCWGYFVECVRWDPESRLGLAVSGLPRFSGISMEPVSGVSSAMISIAVFWSSRWLWVWMSSMVMSDGVLMVFG